MSYLDDCLELMETAFEADDLMVVMACLHKAFWMPVDKRSEIVALLRETAAALPEGERRSFCLTFADRIDALPPGKIGLQAFMETGLDVTGWARPSPSRAARAYVEFNEIMDVLWAAQRQVASERASRRLREYERELRVDRAKRIGLAVCTLGASLAFEGL